MLLATPRLHPAQIVRAARPREAAPTIVVSTLHALASHPPPAVGSERPTVATWAALLIAIDTHPLGTGALDELSVPLPSGAPSTLPLGAAVSDFMSAPLPSGAQHPPRARRVGPRVNPWDPREGRTSSWTDALRNTTSQRVLSNIYRARSARASAQTPGPYVPPASALAALSIAVPRANVPRRGSDDTCDLRPGSTYGAGLLGPKLHTAAYAPSDLAPPAYIAPPTVSIWVSICVLQGNQQPLCASRFSGYGSGGRDAEELGLARAPGPGAGLYVAPEISTR
ncbi:uncharacterized protein TRAVEDRAFT_52669 [Trametes versicolor FP-101664 SS1]|uniref:uncharacterized protein n=1 Tax=Trametes versicolor (strain FP-101664) TaxID=717944 RepID=UPI000462215F|nr:uncharacterized protein TRAVEDRAFT_52669 [Trametes versicolor FP-101664 SS1]EIW53541.1 hypothetical protein TRAVEDRAFT_52669 [Trametes versicolor FP-101664 SS1]